MKCHIPFSAVFSVVCLATATHSQAAETANWPGWRGPHDNRSTSECKLPTQIDASVVLWKTPLPGKGVSTPILWDQRIYLTAPIGGKDALLAYDWSGKELWQTALGSGETPGRHRNGSGSNPSPVTDGKTLFVHFKSGQLAAVNKDGTVRWQTNLVERFGPVKLLWDHGTSPVLTDKNVIVARMHGGESWIAAFDKETGEMRWQTPRNYEVPKEVDNGYTTPLIIRHEGKDAVLTWAAQHLTMHDAANGKLVWSCGNFNPDSNPQWPAIATPLVIDGVAVVCFGRADRGIPRLHGIKLSGNGDVTATNRLWVREDTGSFVPSPVEYKGCIYVLGDRGQVDCVDPKTGKSLWTDTFPRSSSNFYSSPLVANGVMYAVREDGTMFVARVEGGFKVLAQTKFDDRLIASVVPGSDRLFVRGEANLYCLAGP